MNFARIGQLIRLRYKLLWARTRTRNGKIAFFLAGYLLFIGVAVIMASGGFGAGLVAVRAGKAELIAQGVLTGLFVWALATAVMLGFGMNQVFSDTELRRYPLCARERQLARHITGIVDPYWCLFLALELGLAFGLYVAGAGSFLLGVAAALLLYVCNYAAAQVIGALVDRIMKHRGGSLILPLAVVALCVLPGTLMPLFIKSRVARTAVAQALAFTPTFGAGSLMTRSGLPALHGFGLLACWLAGLTAALVYLERHPPKVRSAAGATRMKWNSPFEPVGRLFGPRHGELVAFWLRFYFRCKRFRMSYLMSLPMLPFLLLVWTRQGPQNKHAFSSALGVFAIAGMAPAAGFLANQFGYTGSGFRRLLLLPRRPGDILRASSYALLAACSIMAVVATAAWVLFPGAPNDVRGLVMLLACFVFGTFLSHGAGLWTSVYGPRRSDPNATMGNDLSWAGNALLIGGMLPLLVGPRLYVTVSKRPITSEYWWAPVLLAALAVWFYAASLARTSKVVETRRERLLAVMDGKG